MRGFLVAVVVLVASCEKQAPPSPELPPAAEVSREVLAAAGYYSWDDSKAAWKKRSAEGIRARDGSELVGTTPGPWYLSDWVGTKPTTLEALRGRVVVVRFWTSPNCPFCAKTLPALQELAAEFADRPVTIIGAYHAKPGNAVSDMKDPAELAADWNVRFPIALDREWQTLRSWWLASAPRNATSVTFVIGRDGKIAFVHPGPVFHRSDRADEAKQNRDFYRVRDAITAALGS